MRENCSHELRAYNIEKLYQDWRILAAVSAGLIYKYIKSRKYTSVQQPWGNGWASARHTAGIQFDTLLVQLEIYFFQKKQRRSAPLTSQAIHDLRLRRSGVLGLQKFLFWSLLLKTNDYACSKRTLKICRALVILIKCLVTWWWTY
jgi:hypothetical protein